MAYMHDLLQEMGREIVREEPSNKTLGCCSRSWDPKSAKKKII